MRKSNSNFSCHLEKRNNTLQRRQEMRFVQFTLDVKSVRETRGYQRHLSENIAKFLGFDKEIKNLCTVPVIHEHQLYIWLQRI